MSLGVVGWDFCILIGFVWDCEVPTSMVNHQLGSQKSRWKLRKTAKEVILVLDNHGLDAELVLFFYLGMG